MCDVLKALHYGPNLKSYAPMGLPGAQVQSPYVVINEDVLGGDQVDGVIEEPGSNLESHVWLGLYNKSTEGLCFKSMMTFSVTN